MSRIQLFTSCGIGKIKGLLSDFPVAILKHNKGDDCHYSGVFCKPRSDRTSMVKPLMWLDLRPTKDSVLGSEMVCLNLTPSVCGKLHQAFNNQDFVMST